MVVKLAWLHELPHSQIALVLEIPTGTVKSRVSRARQLLQESVRRQDA
ncbi:sigma factor-like helix-turn-helix DNA-binding protein [Auritidibacter ignavus]